MADIKQNKRAQFAESENEWFDDSTTSHWITGWQRMRSDTNRPLRFGFERHGVRPAELVTCEPTSKGGVMYVMKTSTPAAAAQQVELEWRQLELEERVSTLESLYSTLYARVSALNCDGKNSESTLIASNFAVRTSDPAISDVLAVTQELFPGKIGIELSSDPVEPDVDIVIVCVDGIGSFDTLIDREIEWGNRIAALKPRYSGQLRLNVVPQK
jgi:hypothetical protein